MKKLIASLIAIIAITTASLYNTNYNNINTTNAIYMEKLSVDNITYEFFDTHATVVSYSGTEKNIIIPDTINGIPVKIIGENAFAGTNIESITLPGELLVIRANAFKDCTNLKNVLFKTIKDSNGMFVSLSTKLSIIDENAFYNTAISGLDLPEGLLYIRNNAFYNSPIVRLSIPESVIEIDGTIIGHDINLNNRNPYIDVYDRTEIRFKGNSCNITTNNLVDNVSCKIIGNKNSDIESYAINNGYTFEPIKTPDEVYVENNNTIDNDVVVTTIIEDVVIPTTEIITTTSISSATLTETITEINTTTAVSTFAKSTSIAKTLDDYTVNELKETIINLTAENNALKAIIQSHGNKAYGDMNNDGFVDGRDATIILTYYARISTGYVGTIDDFIREQNGE
jgi:hypothetical protein